MKILLYPYLMIGLLFSQFPINLNFSKRLALDSGYISPISLYDNDQKFKLYLNNNIYTNSNLPNIENQNGDYYPKGYGLSQSLLFYFNNKLLSIIFEPKTTFKREFSVSAPEKQNVFSVLNDVPLIKKFNNQKIKNLNLNFHYQGVSLGFGNINKWWGPGIHNSLIMSNNAEGYYRYYINYETSNKEFNVNDFSIEHSISNPIMSFNGSKFFITSTFSKLKYNRFTLGGGHLVLTGGYNDLKWNQNDALFVTFTKDKERYWDSITQYYISYNNEYSGLQFFAEYAYPNRSFSNREPSIFNSHAIASNLGLRKKGAFNLQKLVFGVEYTRLVQGTYYNILPTPNWYDNIKFNYYSYNYRFWAAHSGSDSDDMLMYLGYLDDKKSFVYGINYERHGVNFHFPPEVKFENRFSATYIHKNFYFNLIYESEFFEHYGFVDNSDNVWNENYNNGSLQRTRTLLFLIETKIH